MLEHTGAGQLKVVVANEDWSRMLVVCMEQTELGLTGLVDALGSGSTVTTRPLVTPVQPFAEGVTK